MQLSTAVRPISDVKAQAAEIIRTFSEEAAPPVVITQNGEAKAVLMGIHEYERMQETLAMLKALSLSGKSFEAGKGRPAREIFARLRAKGVRCPPFPLGRHIWKSCSPQRQSKICWRSTPISGQCRPAQADTILGKLEQAIRSLHSLPQSGNAPPGLYRFKRTSKMSSLCAG